METILASESTSSVFPDEEHEARVNLAALYRLFVNYGWTDLTYTHISARVRAEKDCYLINPYGLMF
jgi:ribulose-5-phosphate 4-epimerase/fuculose-1-phosphate aldolase